MFTSDRGPSAQGVKPGYSKEQECRLLLWCILNNLLYGLPRYIGPPSLALSRESSVI